MEINLSTVQLFFVGQSVQTYAVQPNIVQIQRMLFYVLVGFPKCSNILHISYWILGKGK